MSATPAVSIIIPAYNGQSWITAALESCVEQSLASIEIICVDDASTDSTRALIEGFCARDSRIRLIALEVNGSALQARRVGVESASAPYVLFLDADDELVPDAAQTALAHARAADADMVGFGVAVISPSGERLTATEAHLRPRHPSLSGPAVLSNLFAPGRAANRHLWGYLLKTELVRRAYAELSSDLHLRRANDLPVVFLVAARASSYVSTSKRLYRYHVRRGLGRRGVADIGDFAFYLEAVRSIEVLRASVSRPGAGWADTAVVQACYRSARLSVIGNVLKYCMGAQDTALQDSCLTLLQEKVDYLDILGASIGFYPEALPAIKRASSRAPAPVRRSNVRHVLLATTNLSTGGVQGVVAAQARYLHEAGFRLTVALFNGDTAVYDLPPGVRVVILQGATRAEMLESWADLCRDSDVDIIIDHSVLYNQRWPFYALAAQSFGIGTIGCLQSFALRPLLNDNDNTSFLVANLPLLDTVTTLSPTDVAFWKLRGIAQVVCIPNPPSPLLLELPVRTAPRTPPVDRVRLVWWGRLQESTKQVRSLIPITAALRDRGVDAELTIIGANSHELTAEDLRADAASSGIADRVHFSGPLHGQALADKLADAHVYVLTSVIEGSPLALIEAQAIGLPVAMFELPWLANLVGNDGVVTVPQHDVGGLAREIEALVSDPDRYTALSAGSLDAARRATDFDFAELYRQLVAGKLPKQYSVEPTLEHVRLLLEWTTFYAEANSARHNEVLRSLRQSDRQVARLDARVARLQAQVTRLRKEVSDANSGIMRRVLRAVRSRIRGLIARPRSSSL